MRFEGEPLLNILRQQTEPVMVCDAAGVPFTKVHPVDVLCSTRGFGGIGNRRRIRYLQASGPGVRGACWRGGSRTIKRVPILNHQGEKITGLLITEHRGLAPSNNPR